MSDGMREAWWMSEQDAAAVWEARYAERDQIWTGRPNQALVSTVAGLSAGRALDLGCGEGADSVWLAEQRWQVTAVDISATAVNRARALAAAHGIPDGAINWVVQDLESWAPPDSYELISACFLHSSVEFARTPVLRRAADAVVPGGHLLVVGHAEAPPWAENHDHPAHRFVGPEAQVAELHLGEGRWEVVISEERSREATGPDGQPAQLRDSVVLARRRND